MSDILSLEMPRTRRQAVAVSALAVPPRAAGQMLGYGVTTIYALLNRGELQGFKDGGARRILVSSINNYIARKMAAGETENRCRVGGPGRPRKTAAAQPTA
jgi:Helix-turn-helix domain